MYIDKKFSFFISHNKIFLYTCRGFRLMLYASTNGELRNLSLVLKKSAYVM